MAIAIAGCVALAVAMGIGRFAFTPILPMMQADYGMTVGQASHRLSRYAIDASSGGLTRLGDQPVGRNPNWVEIVELPD